MDSYKARVEFADAKWLVIDAFKHNGKAYMYLGKDIDGDVFRDSDIKKYKEQMEFIFIEKVEDDYYSKIEDNNLINELCEAVTKRNFSANN